MTRLTDTINVIVPVGALGAGVRAADLEHGLALGAHAIACDAGSTDSGPAYLATGRSKYSRDAVKTDLTHLMRAQVKSGLPLLIGSCGTSGADDALDWTRDIVLEIARAEGFRPKVALLYSEQNKEAVAAKAKAGKIRALAPLTNAGPEIVEGCDRIVALMGPEPYIAALQAGADIVLGGRTTDTAVIAAVPLMKGAGAGPAWHAGKIAECGGQCTTNVRDGGVLIRVGKEAFEIEPLSPTNRCEPYSVSAHLLYENTDPLQLLEPGGVLDVSAATYTAVDERVVRVDGSRFEPRPYTMKLEGAGAGAFQTVMLVGICDPKVLAELPLFLSQMHGHLIARVNATMGERAGDFDISLRPYGYNAVLDDAPGPDAPAPREIGLLFVATAPSQEIATQIAKTCNPMFFHMPLRVDQELPSYAFPFSPAEMERGRVFEFRLNHVVEVEDGLELVRITHIPQEGLVNA